MSFFKAFRTLLNLRTLAVALIFSAIIFYYYSSKDWSLEIPVTIQKRIDLLAELESAVPDQGFEGKKFYLRIHDVQIVHDNEDDDRMYILAGPNSQFHYDGLPIHRKACLKVGIGFYEVMEGSPLLPVTFQVACSDGGEEKLVFSKVITPRGHGRIKQIVEVEHPIDDAFAGENRLIFRCVSNPNYKYSQILCSWTNPRIDSAGKRVQMKKVLFDRSSTAFDFIEEGIALPSGNQNPGEGLVWGRGPGGEAYAQPGPCVKDYQFIPSSDLTETGSGARAAIAMAEDYRLDVPGVRVPDADDVSLRFAIGLKEISCAAGGADFIVRVDGREVFREGVAGGGVSDRWRERRIDLEDHAGERIQVSFEVRFPGARPTEVEAPPLHPLRAGGESLTVRVERPIAGFGHPVLVADHETHRRLSSRSRPNLIILNIECLHSGYLGCYGSPLGLTPVIDALADEGILFKDFIATSSWTLPSVATLLTGVYPSIHGATREDRTFLPNRFRTLPELLQEQGITTAAFLTNPLINRDSNFDQGFETFVLAPYQNARKVNALFDNWLASNADFRFFAYFHFFEPHDPCNAPGGLRDRYVPEPLRGRDGETHAQIVKGLTEIMVGKSDKPYDDDIAYLKGRYFGEIRYMDLRIAELLRILKDRGLRERTVVIITGDHGEEFMEHGYLGHGSHLFNETIRVPLIVWGPKDLLGGHRIVEGASDNAALLATAARLMDVPIEAPLRREVRPGLFPFKERFGGEARFAFSETDKAVRDPRAERIEIKPLFAIMDWRFKLISDGDRFEFYDCAEDPEEKHDLSGRERPEEKRLRKQLEGICNQLREYADRHYGSSMDARKMEILKGLGYTGN